MTSLSTIISRSKMHIKLIKKWNRTDIILFLERLEMYVSAGLPINRALYLLGEHNDKQKHQAISKMATDFERGYLLSHCFAKHIGLSTIICHMIEYGELSGKLNRSILLSIKLLIKEDELWKKCLNALLYPVFVGSFSLILTFVLIQKVLSEIIPLLNSLKIDLPLVTKIVITISDVFRNYGIFIVFGIILILITITKIYSKSQRFCQFVHNLVLRMPIIGKIVYNYHLSLFFQSCGSLVESGLTISQAYLRSQKSPSFWPLKILLSKYAGRIGEGMPLSRVFESKHHPQFLYSIISAGENSGSLGQSIMRAHEILDRDLDQFIKKFTVLIEPIMMIVMGFIVGTIAISIMIPIYSISNSLQK